MLTFTVPGRPITWQRPTDDRRSGRRNVTSAEQRKEKRRIATLARAALPPGWPTDAEYAIEVIGYWPDRRFGDADRLVSLTMDALEGVAYRADRQVVAQGGARRLDRELPRVEVTLVPLREGEEVSINIEIGSLTICPHAWVVTPTSAPQSAQTKAPRRVNARGRTEPGKVAR